MTKEQKSNAVIRSIQARYGQAPAPPQMPVNARLGGTGGGLNNYGSSRGVGGSYSDKQLQQWRTSKGGTSQDRFAATRLPGDN